MDTPHHEYGAKQGEQRRLADLLRMPVLLNFSQTSIPLLFGALGVAPAFWTMAAALLVGGGYARRGYNGAPPAARKKKRPATALARDGRPQDEQ